MGGLDIDVKRRTILFLACDRPVCSMRGHATYPLLNSLFWPKQSITRQVKSHVSIV